MTSPGVFWLTRDFRFSDNPALLAALAEGPVLPVFVIDSQLRAQGSASRWRLERALKLFDAEMRRRSGRGVLALEGEPAEILPDLLRRTGARRAHRSDWPTPQTRAMQANFGDALTLHPGHLLTDPRKIRTGEGGAYRVFTPFARALRRLGPDRPAAEAPQRIEAFHPPLAGLDVQSLDLAPDLRRGRAVLERFAAPVGEAAAFARLEAFLERASDYARDRDRFDLEAGSGLSEHLALGEISPRSLWAVASFHAAVEPGAAGGLEKFLSEALWREFAWSLLIEFPHMAAAPWRPEWADFPWRGASPESLRWIRAETGVPLVDAGLREMRVTGRMQNRVRMAAASWLTKHLLTDWRIGLRHFEDSLTDWDPASNAMNWQWVAGCGPDASPFFRIFNPEKQAARFDPEGRYLAKWLSPDSPEAQAYLETLPLRWGAPTIRREAGAAALEEGRRSALESYREFRARSRDKRRL